ncbi:MFS general substrate transporter [Apiospora saccharicola]
MDENSQDLNDSNRGSTTMAIPMQQIQSGPSQSGTARHEFSLPPVDTGKDAWCFLAACWAVEALVWGFSFSFGVFQDYYSSHEPFRGSGNIASIGTTTMGVMYIGTPVVIALCRLFPRQARWFTLAGLFVASLAMAMSSFCSTVPQLLGVQGWFVRRKGMAYGIMWSAAGFGGVVLPLLLESLLGRFGFATAMRIWSGILFAAAAPLALFIKPRLPHSPSVSSRVRTFDMAYVKTRLFALHQLANVIQATGYFLPGIYLPAYARAQFGASGFLAALTVILVNIAATVGSVMMGSLSDRLHVTTCVILSAIGGTTAVLLIWGLSSSLGVLYLFCTVYGLFAGVAQRATESASSEGAEGQGGQGNVDPIMVFGWLCVGRGVGNVISGPLSESLLKGMPWQGLASAGYGSGYGSLIVYTGVTGLLSGTSFVWKRVGIL